MGALILELVWLVPLLPLAGVLTNGLFGHKIGRGAHKVAIATTGLSAALALLIFVAVATGKSLDWDAYTWVSAGSFQATVGILVDPLSAVMMVVVTFVGFLIHVYSKGYMHDDPGYARFFTYMNLFMVSMLVLVLANNYLLMFLGWEGVGLCSYLLIGFWYEKRSASDAGKKAFVVNRIGDAGFLLGLFLIWRTFGSLQYSEVFGGIDKAKGVLLRPSVLGLTLVTVMCLLLFVGAIGKSAQLPLYVWLPDAMEGPTPVSALIHAATMVTAGVYMVARSAPLFNQAPTALLVVAVVGALTAVFAATIACAQNDIKRVVAYSTISQLGYMFLGCGVGAYASAVFHLGTHAFFKALLFLGAGSVIHALSGEQDIRKMGGLWSVLPLTAGTFLIGSLANIGLVPLAGFWSKDEILTAAFAGGHWFVGLLGLAGAALTAFYMWRLFLLVFRGVSRVDPHAAHHLHESPPVMGVPLLVLAVGAAFAGFVGFPPDAGVYHHFVEAAFKAEAHAPPGALAWTVAGVSTLMAGLGIGVAWHLYGRRPESAARLVERYPTAYRWILNKYYADELYDAAVVEPIRRGSIRLWQAFDERVVDGLVNKVGAWVQEWALGMRRVQTGAVPTYVLSFLVGVVAILGYLLFAR